MVSLIFCVDDPYIHVHVGLCLCVVCVNVFMCIPVSVSACVCGGQRSLWGPSLFTLHLVFETSLSLNLELPDKRG